jgi:hypothetical protein
MPSMVFSGCAKPNKEKRSPKKEEITLLNCFQMLFRTLAAGLAGGAAPATGSSEGVWLLFIDGV